MPERNPRGKSPGNPLKAVCAAGLALSLVLSWGLVFFALIWRGGSPGSGSAGESTFARELESYDLFNAPKLALEGENPELIEGWLFRLQKKAGGVEEYLSVLKRRRALALIDRRYIPAYENAAREAAEVFPYSAPLAAVAVDALVTGGGVLSEEALAGLGTYAERVSQSRFGLLELSVRILAGDLRDPARAAAVSGLENLLSSVSPSFPEENREFLSPGPLPEQARRELLVNEFLLRAVRGDIPGASLRLNSLLSSYPDDAGLTRMGAEFFYDNAHPLRAAELFSRLAGEEPLQAGRAPAESFSWRDIARAADALVFAGEIAGARNIWFALSSGPSSGDAASAGIQSRSLYNLAAVSVDAKEEAALLEKLFSLRSPESQNSPGMYETDSLGVYSIIRYTRLLDTSRAAAVLDDENMKKYPLLDLELLRRRLESLPPTRAAAEVWFLLERNSGEAALYEWAAWYFDHQKLYDETERLLAEAVRKGMAGPWLQLHRALAFVREGKAGEAEKLLAEAAKYGKDWRIPANLGRIEESRRAISAALEYYEAAAALVSEKKQAAIVQTRLSRCFEALGRLAESRKALETALELDPDNLNIRRELRRF